MTIQDTAQADVAPLSTSSSPQELEDVMAVARAAAESQAELEEQGIDPLGPTDAGDDDQVDEDEDLGDDEPEQPRQDHAAPADVPVPTAQDITAVKEMFVRSGSNEEFEALKQKVVGGKATQAEQAQVKAMAEWRQILGPLYRTLIAEGARLGQAQRVAAPTKARPAARSSTTKPASNAQTAAAARPKASAPAPAKKPAAAATSPKVPKLPPMLNLDGTLNPDFERLAHSGALYGRERLTED